jgi:hypothetical protein
MGQWRQSLAGFLTCFMVVFGTGCNRDPASRTIGETRSSEPNDGTAAQETGSGSIAGQGAQDGSGSSGGDASPLQIISDSELKQHPCAAVQILSNIQKVTFENVQLHSRLRETEKICRTTGRVQSKEFVFERRPDAEVSVEFEYPVDSRFQYFQLIGGEHCEILGGRMTASAESWRSSNTMPITADTIGMVKMLVSVEKSPGVTLKPGRNTVFVRYFENCLPGDTPYKHSRFGSRCGLKDVPGDSEVRQINLQVSHTSDVVAGNEERSVRYCQL